MSQAIVAGGVGGSDHERSWTDLKWFRSRERTTTSAGTGAHIEVTNEKLPAQINVKQVAPTIIPAMEIKDGKRTPSKKRASRLAFKKYSISELADPTLIQPPKALISQEGSGLKSKSTSSLSNLARRGSWMVRSRSPSPGKHRRTPSTNVSKPEKAVTKTVESPTKDVQVEISGSLPGPQRRPSLPRTGRPLSAIFTRSASNPQISTAIRKARSIERLPSAIIESVPELPTPSRIQLFQAVPTEAARKKDELFTTFRTLDQEYAKFIAKPSSFKMTVVRATLLPFLQQYANHPSNKLLRAEDLDRRVQILNKWWVGLLDVVTSRSGYALAASDRPAVLDALAGIMQRPEWRQTARSLTSSRQNTSRTSSSISLATTSSDVLTDSVLKNTRGMFVQNLLAQMNFAVDRLSLRTVAASMVAFCGKAIAYAFFFCPGVADILVRLWNQPQATLRRVLDEAGCPRNTNLKEISAGVADMFPAHLQHLCLRTLPLLNRSLRERHGTHANLNNINWDGPWIGRWSGRDSDLFFSFTKHYHGLMFDILGDDCTDKERICAPGALLIYGQMLTIMDATIQVHRHPSVPSQAITFDDILGADASAAAMSIRAPNTARLMGENRLITLLRETLSDTYPSSPAVKLAFAAMFGNLLKAATKKTSVTDADACFTLCDFLEESMFILTRFFRNAEDPTAFLDWPFWLDVLKRLGDSNNTMTEVRLYAFVYSLWSYITKDESKKRDLCLGWLLQEDYAYRQFNHWCPMVRAYYHRLLIWRVARCDASASLLDVEIFTTLLSLLQKLFSQYLHKLSSAEQEGMMLPSSTPASPAPGRRLLIIRDDSMPTSVLTNFLVSSTDHSSYQKITSLDTLNKLAESPDSFDKTSKKRFTFLRNLNPFLNVAAVSPDSSNAASPQNSPPSSTHTPGDSTGTSTPESHPSRPNTPPEPTLDFIPNRSFKFSLEWVDRPYPYRMDRRLYPPRLPPTAQAVISNELAEAIVLGDVIPSKEEEPASRYVGIALAEWSILVVECSAFAERRRHEGVPANRIETPVLCVETFRKPVG